MREVHPWYVLMDVTSQGPPGSLHEPLSEALAGALEAGLIRDALIAASGAQAAKLWKMRESLAEAQVSAGGSIAHDVSVPVSRIPEFIARADAALERRLSRHPPLRLRPRRRRQHALQPRAAAGLGLAALSPGSAPRINRIVHDIVVELGGSISAEHGIGRSRLAELAALQGAGRARA